MTWVAGVDGCRAGWMLAAMELHSGSVTFDVLSHVGDLWSRAWSLAVVAIDIPIGLPATGPRSCDVEARRLLGPRRSSVFPAPIRAALGAGSRAEADEITRRMAGKGVSAQAWGLNPKIREVDALLASSESARRTLVEVHPELSFRCWNGGVPMRAAKKTPEGLQERLALCEPWLGGQLLERARGGRPRSALASDDILDAVAALWSARRIFQGVAETIPAAAPSDAAGLPMRIVY